jgi:hypothetical protein
MIDILPTQFFKSFDMSSFINMHEVLEDLSE